jgi:hypothetical protein
MKRICPSCKSVLSKSSVYFCEFCGSPLPEGVRLDNISHRNVKKIEDSGKKQKKLKEDDNGFSNTLSLISARSVILGFILGIIVSSFFYLYFKAELFVYVSRFFKNQSHLTKNIGWSEDLVVNESQNQENIDEYVELELGIKSGPFGQYEVTTYVPYEASFYMEFSDSSTIEPYFGFLGGDLFTLSENIKDNIEPFYSAFYMNKGIKSGWVILTFLKDENFEVGNYGKIFTDKIGQVLIISSEPVLIDEVKLARSEITKNLSLHPSLISVKPILPDSGKIFIFKIQKSGDGVLESLEDETLSEEFKMVLEEYKNFGSPYLVIK